MRRESAPAAAAVFCSVRSPVPCGREAQLGVLRREKTERLLSPAACRPEIQVGNLRPRAGLMLFLAAPAIAPCQAGKPENSRRQAAGLLPFVSRGFVGHQRESPAHKGRASHHAYVGSLTTLFTIHTRWMGVLGKRSRPPFWLFRQAAQIAKTEAEVVSQRSFLTSEPQRNNSATL